MKHSDLPAIRAHEDAEMFREAVRFTAAQTGFTPRLIEKDYFCTLMLAHVSAARQAVFKGGTCLAKVHAEFYRLSEDLDFTIPVDFDTPRPARSKQAAAMRQVVHALSVPFHVTTPLRGHNNSTQYNGAASYTSLLNAQEEAILIEVSLREPLLTPLVEGLARTVLLDPVSAAPMVSGVPVRCISRIEAFAEKFRAALSRREVAIRDFFDLDYAVQKLGFQPGDPALVRMVRQKLNIPGNDPVNVGAERLLQLRGQLDARLKPVLRPADFAVFDLNRAIALVTEMARAVVTA
jgi:predicted nucleotidyltransferase component of viral defense system